jgi:hypothetical protein
LPGAPDAQKNGEVVVPAGGETGGPRCLAEVYKLGIQPGSAYSKSECNATKRPVKCSPRKPSTYQGDVATPFHSIEQTDYTSFNIAMQDKKPLFSYFPAPVPVFADCTKSRPDNLLQTSVTRASIRHTPGEPPGHRTGMARRRGREALTDSPNRGIRDVVARRADPCCTVIPPTRPGGSVSLYRISYIQYYHNSVAATRPLPARSTAGAGWKAFCPARGGKSVAFFD